MTQTCNSKQIADETAGAHLLILGEHILSRDQLVDEIMASKILMRATQTLRNDRHLRRGCKYVKIFRSVRYRVGDLLDYQKRHTIDPEAA